MGWLAGDQQQIADGVTTKNIFIHSSRKKKNQRCNEIIYGPNLLPHFYTFINNSLRPNTRLIRRHGTTVFIQRNYKLLAPFH